MTSETHLPFELLEHIASFLQGDLRTLRNLSSSCRTFDDIAKPHIFSVVEFRALPFPALKPYLHYVKELRIIWGPDMFNASEAELLDGMLVPNLSPDITPRLRSLVVRGIGHRGTSVLSDQQQILSTFTSLTSLELRDTLHRSFADLSALICALPRLKSLRFRTVEWRAQEGYEVETETAESDGGSEQGPHLESLCVSPTYPAKTFRFVRWLSNTPCKQSLKRLDIPYSTHNASELVSLFGPSVECLTTPIRRLKALADALKNYTALVELTLLMHPYQSPNARWDGLPALFSSLPSPHLLRTITLHLGLARLRAEDEVCEGVVHRDKLEETDRLLIPEPDAAIDSTDKSATTSKFKSLRLVNVLVRTAYPMSAGRKEVFEQTMRRLMSRCSTNGKLKVEYEAQV